MSDESNVRTRLGKQKCLESSVKGRQRQCRRKLRWQAATENARLLTVERWTGGWTRQSLQEERSPRWLGRSAT